MSVLRAAAAAAVVLSAGAPAPASADTAGAHRLIVTGGARGDRIALRVGPATPHRLDVDIGDDGTVDRRFKLDRIDEVLVRGGAGGDLLRVDRAAPLPASLPVTLSGGAGNDVLVGANGAEQVSGGLGHDLADPGRGGDAVELGDGNDTAVWNPGDGSDTIDGEGGRDLMAFNGAGAGERMDLSAEGPVLRLFRDVGTITMFSTSVEVVKIAAAGGADHVGVGDLSGTGVTEVDADLADDATADEVVLAGTPDSDHLVLAGAIDQVAVGGLPAVVRVGHADAADSLIVDSAGGADTIDGASLTAGLITLTEDGGTGADTLRGSQGDDSAIWNPGDGSDTIDGEAGGDVLRFNGANGGESADVSAVGERVRFFRDPGAIAMDLGSVEGIDFAALGGPDHVRVGDLTGTPVRKVVADLAAGAGTADGLADTVTVVGTAGVDAVTVAGGGALIRTTGLPAIVDVAHPDGALDLLEVDTGGGDDTVDSSALAPGAIGLSVLP